VIVNAGYHIESHITANIGGNRSRMTRRNIVAAASVRT
jgi:hypothetical protein